MTARLEQEPFGLPHSRLDKLRTDHRAAEAQFSHIYDYIDSVLGRDNYCVFYLDNMFRRRGASCKKKLSDVLGDTLTVAAILTEAAEHWREVTGVVTGGPEADTWDTIDELLAGP
jgi:hypothetical protein